MPGDDHPPDVSAPERSADEVWLAALAGRAPGVAGTPHADVALEALEMRRALREWAPAVDAVAADDPARIAALLARARAQGLLEERHAPDPRDDRHALRRPRWPRRLRDWWTSHRLSRTARRPAWAMAAAVVAVVALVYVMRPASERAFDGDATVRSPSDTVTLLRAPDAEALRREIVAALARRGVKVTSYTRFGRVGIDGDLPRPLPAALKAVLERYRIPAPDDGILRVEIEEERR